MNTFEDKTILITGGTGSFGNAFVERVHFTDEKKIIIFSRDEYKQHIMNEKFPDTGPIRYFIGDVRDKNRLMRAFKEVDIIIHAAALKHVSTGEVDPIEMIMTNIVGTINVVEAAIENNVDKIILLSTDKAVEPLNLYGATKMTAEKLFMAANSYVGAGDSKFSVVRYGNVWGSRGGVIDIWNKQAPEGEIFITTPYATRFIITLEEAVEFIIESIDKMKGLEIFIPPDLPAVNMDAVAREYQRKYECKVTDIPVRIGEKIHEKLDEGYTSDQVKRLSRAEIRKLLSS